MINEIQRLLKNGCLGFYDQVEVTEVFACLPDKTVINVFTIVVAEDRNGAEQIKREYLSEKLFKIKKLKECLVVKKWSFGIKRYTKNISDFIYDLIILQEKKQWSASGDNLLIENLEYQPPRFVTTTSLPLTKVLKNNFWNGSYIIEWYDKEKTQFIDFLENPTLLQELSEKINLYCPISLESVSDRLGNIILQIPVTILMARFSILNINVNDLKLQIAWHEKAEQRPLRLNCEQIYDNTFNSYFSCEIKGETTIIPISYDYGLNKAVLWDDENKLILSTSEPNFIRTFSLGMNIINNEHRIFKIDGQEVRICVVNQINNSVGTPSSIIGSWTQKRIYKDEKEELRKNRKFVQYYNGMHEQALQDIRLLISQYGGSGVWLWDTYLSSDDILKTLFYSSVYGADLRAITNLGTHSESTAHNKSEQLIAQRQVFEKLESNFLGLKLEFRARIGNVGWEFHDRFLIFPNTSQGTLAWSLGTSVNSVGKSHNILQQVDDGQLVADAFIELWDQLDKPENLVWKK